MTNKIICFIPLVWMALASQWVNAQQQSETRFRIDRQANRVTNDDMLVVDFDLSLSADQLPASYEMALRPVITDGNANLKELPPVLVEGVRRSKLNRRLRSLGKDVDESEYVQVIRLNRGEKNRSVFYTTSINYESWMEDAEIAVIVDECGCGTRTDAADRIVVSAVPALPVNMPSIPPKVIPQPTKPIVTDVSRTVSLLFKLSKASLDAAFGDNAAHLKEISEHLRYASTTTAVDNALKITIHAYASPEGFYHTNLALSQQRAEAVKQYLIEHLNVSPDVITVHGGGEHWDGLTRMIEQDNLMKNRNEVLDIIRGVSTFDGREGKLMRLNNGAPYRYMFEHFFPKLRTAEVKIEFKTQAFQ